MRNKSASVARHMVTGGIFGGLGGGLTGSQISDGTGVEAEWPWQEDTPDGDYRGEGAAIGVITGGLLGRYTGGLSRALKGSRLDVQKGIEALKKEKEQAAMALKKEKEQAAMALKEEQKVHKVRMDNAKKDHESFRRLSKSREDHLTKQHAEELKKVKADRGDPERLKELENEIYRQQYFRMEAEHVIDAHRANSDLLARMGKLDEEMWQLERRLRYSSPGSDKLKTVEAEITALKERKRNLVDSYEEAQKANTAARKEQLEAHAEASGFQGRMHPGFEDWGYNTNVLTGQKAVKVRPYDPYGGIEGYYEQMGDARHYGPGLHSLGGYTSILKKASLNAQAPEDYVKLAYAYGNLMAKTAELSSPDSSAVSGILDHLNRNRLGYGTALGATYLGSKAYKAYQKHLDRQSRAEAKKQLEDSLANMELVSDSMSAGIGGLSGAAYVADKLHFAQNGVTDTSKLMRIAQKSPKAAIAAAALMGGGLGLGIGKGTSHLLMEAMGGKDKVHEEQLDSMGY